MYLLGKGLMNGAHMTQRGREGFLPPLPVPRPAVVLNGQRRRVPPCSSPKRTRSHRDGEGRARQERWLEKRVSGTEEPDHRVQVREYTRINTTRISRHTSFLFLL